MKELELLNRIKNVFAEMDENDKIIAQTEIDGYKSMVEGYKDIAESYIANSTPEQRDALKEIIKLKEQLDAAKDGLDNAVNQTAKRK